LKQGSDAEHLILLSDNENVEKDLIGIIFILFSFSTAFGLSTEQIFRLKQAGLSQETIRLMIREKSNETCSLTVEEAINLKKAGIDEDLIQTIIKEGSFINGQKEIIYGKTTRDITHITIDDVIRLKRAGISDDTIKEIVTYGKRTPEEREREEILELLKHFGIIIDKRKGINRD